MSDNSSTSKNSYTKPLIIAVLVLFLLIFLLFLGVFSLSGTTQNYTDDITTLQTQTIDMNYVNGTTTFNDDVVITGNLALGTITNVATDINTLKTDTTEMSYSDGTTTFTGNLSVEDILLVNGVNYSTSLAYLQTQTTNITYDSGLTSFGDNDVEITGNLALGTIPNVESEILALELTTTSAENGIIYAPEINIVLESISVAGITTTNGVVNTGTISTTDFNIIQNFLVDELDLSSSLIISDATVTNGITDSGDSTFVNLTVTGAFSSDSSGLSVTTSLNTKDIITFGSGGTAFTMIQRGYQPPIDNDSEVLITFINTFPGPPMVFATPTNKGGVVTPVIYNPSTTGFSYQLFVSDNTCNNNFCGFNWIAIY
jgi:hypothetical protein